VADGIPHMLGGGMLVSALPARVLERIRSGEADPGAPLVPLTDRELEVFDLVSRR
jgi:hypothetical protein